uniref:PHD-type domain-containing protein n=1 Tax=Macrostomum lignano TaxID=282301 RepID=A0A1I8FH00_9PLAT
CPAASSAAPSWATGLRRAPFERAPPAPAGSAVRPSAADSGGARQLRRKALAASEANAGRPSSGGPVSRELPSAGGPREEPASRAPEQQQAKTGRQRGAVGEDQCWERCRWQLKCQRPQWLQAAGSASPKSLPELLVALPKEESLIANSGTFNSECIFDKMRAAIAAAAAVRLAHLAISGSTSPWLYRVVIVYGTRCNRPETFNNAQKFGVIPPFSCTLNRTGTQHSIGHRALMADSASAPGLLAVAFCCLAASRLACSRCPQNSSSSLQSNGDPPSGSTPASGKSLSKISSRRGLPPAGEAAVATLVRLGHACCQTVVHAVVRLGHAVFRLGHACVRRGTPAVDWVTPVFMDRPAPSLRYYGSTSRDAARLPSTVLGQCGPGCPARSRQLAMPVNFSSEERYARPVQQKPALQFQAQKPVNPPPPVEPSISPAAEEAAAGGAVTVGNSEESRLSRHRRRERNLRKGGPGLLPIPERRPDALTAAQDPARRRRRAKASALGVVGGRTQGRSAGRAIASPIFTRWRGGFDPVDARWPLRHAGWRPASSKQCIAGLGEDFELPPPQAASRLESQGDRRCCGPRLGDLSAQRPRPPAELRRPATNGASC